MFDLRYSTVSTTINGYSATPPLVELNIIWCYLFDWRYSISYLRYIIYYLNIIISHRKAIKYPVDIERQFSTAKMSRIVTAFNKTVVEYFRKTSLNGFGLLYFIRKRRIQRIFWFLFISFGILFASYAVFSMVLEFLSYSTIADLSELKVLEDEIHFPELKICSGYKFSYRNMLASAHDLVSSQNKSLDYWLNKLSLLSGYFDALSVKAENVDDLNSLLDIKNISSFLLALTPACESLILKCKLNNIPANCLKLFTLKAYNDGNCCVLRNSNLTGELTLFMDSSQIDEYPLNGNLPGFSLHVPSWQGRVSINPGEMAAVEIEVMELQGNSQLNEYAVEKRACYFSQEGESREKCLHECRIKATLINCQCVPYPFEFRTQKFGYCTLENIRCLQLVESEFRISYNSSKVINSY